MSTPFLGEIKLVSFSFAPNGWALCNGQFLPINQNQALFSLLGTMYGGNGQTTFALPDLRGRAPIHVGSGFTQGHAGGAAAHTLTASEMPQHVHFAQASTSNGNANTGANNILAAANNLYVPQANNPPLQPLLPAAVANAGGGQPHENMQPFLALNFVIALSGIFPSRN